MPNDHYCTIENVYQVYGSTNVNMWADMDADGDPAKIAARINLMISLVAADMDTKFRLAHYEVPVVASNGEVPLEVRYLCARLVGPYLYEARGVQDYDPQTGRPIHRLAYAKESAEKYLEEVAIQKRKLDVR